MNYTYNETMKICYKLYTNITLSWQQARDGCRHDGGDLIIFHSVNDEKFFEAMTKEIYCEYLEYKVSSLFMFLPNRLHVQCAK